MYNSVAMECNFLALKANCIVLSLYEIQQKSVTSLSLTFRVGSLCRS